MLPSAGNRCRAVNTTQSLNAARWTITATPAPARWNFSRAPIWLTLPLIGQVAATVMWADDFEAQVITGFGMSCKIAF